MVRSLNHRPKRRNENSFSAVDLEALTDALIDFKATPVSLRLVRNLARSIGVESRQIPYTQLCEIAHTNRASLVTAIRAMSAGGFIVVNTTTTPHAYQIAPAYHHAP